MKNEPKPRRYLRVRSPDPETDIDAEIEHHLELMAEELRRQGVAPDVARRRAWEQFGDVEHAKRVCRRIDAERLGRRERAERLAGIGQDFRFAWRRAVRRPRVAGAVVLTIMLAVGATTAVTSALYALVLRPLPFPDPDRLVRIAPTRPDLPPGSMPQASPLALEAWAEGATLLDGVAGYAVYEATYGGEDRPRRVSLGTATAGFFELLGVRPALGALFAAEAYRPGADDVVLLSHAFWTSEFGADPSVLGARVNVEGRPLSIAGVLPSSAAAFPESGPDLWVPAAIEPGTWMEGSAWLLAIGRLRSSAGTEQAAAQLTAVSSESVDAAPDLRAARGIDVVPIQGAAAGGSRDLLVLLAAIVGSVLLIACGNIAGLLLAEASGRQREFGIRASLGASPGRLGRQAMIEGLGLSLVGGSAGFALAPLLLRAFVVLYPEPIPRLAGIEPSAEILLLAAAVTTVAGLVASVPHGRVARRSDPGGLLRRVERGPNASQRTFRNAALLVQVALSVAILIPGALLLGSFVRLARVEPGFEPAGVLSFGVFPSRSDYPTPSHILRFHRDLLAGVRSVPGVEQAGAISILPLGEGMWRAAFVPGGSEGLPPEEQPQANVRQVSPGYFRTMRIPLLQGRDFEWTDDESSPGVVVVNRSLAEAAFGSIDAVGRTIGWEGRTWEIVGVVEDVHQHGLTNAPGPEINASLAQYVRHPMRVVARTTGDPIALLPMIDEVLRRLDPGVPLADAATMQRRISTSIAPARFRAFLTISLAVLALIIATVGIYSALVYNLSLQIREIGVRIALGAAPDALRRAVLASVLALVLAGCLFGMAGGALIARALDAWLFQVDPLDPLLFGTVALVMLAFAAAVTIGPAHRASRLDPTAALRAE